MKRTAEQTAALATLMQPKRRNKFGAKPCVIDGIRFASKHEADRYLTLKTLLKVGKISHLVCQPAFEIVVNKVLVGKYTADFRYSDENGAVVVEDAKSVATRTEAYSLRKRLVEALYGFGIREV